MNLCINLQLKYGETYKVTKDIIQLMVQFGNTPDYREKESLM